MSTQLFDLTGRTALVTGSSRGLGLVLARGLARAGARVVLNGRDAEALERTAEGLAADGLEDVRLAPFDVTQAPAVDAAVGALDSSAPIDILVNNAGIQQRAPLHEFPLDGWERIVATNLTSAFLVGRAVGGRMVARGRGKIINVCSVQSELARPGIAPYAATKGGLKMLTQGMCADWAPHGLCVNGLAPGYFATELNRALVEDPEFDAWLRARTPARRWGEPEELVGAAVFLASGASDFVNGQILYVDGGIRAVI